MLYTDPCYLTVTFSMNLYYLMLSFHAKVVHFTFYIVMVLPSVWKILLLISKQKKNILMKATVSQTVMFYFPFGFCGLGKSIQIS